jgi:hypothetical protein
MSASDVEDKPLMLLVRLIQMGTQAEYRKDAGGAAWENALKIAGVPPRTAAKIRSQAPLARPTRRPATHRAPGADEIVG